MNYIWLTMIIGGIVYAGLHGRIEVVTYTAINASDTAVKLAISLTGVMCLWLGIMKIAEKSGLIMLISIILSPILRVLFPSVPRKHPAFGAIVMTISANLLGLGNAVTPLGIKAMNELQRLNNQKETASTAMCTLLALCTTGFTIVPSTVIALRAAANSTNPAEIVGATIIVSFLATITAVFLDWLCRIAVREFK